MRKAILIKPLDGHPEGSERELSNADFVMLERMGAVRAADDDVAPVEPVTIELLRQEHAADLEAAREREGKLVDQVRDTCTRAETAERELGDVRQQFAEATQRADQSQSNLTKAKEQLADLTAKLQAARTPEGGVEKAAEVPSNKMAAEPANKAANTAPKRKAADAAD